MSKLQAMLNGLSDPKKGREVTLETITSQTATPEEANRYLDGNPMNYNYHKQTRDVTEQGSLIQLTKDRLYVSIEYLIAFCDIMHEYDGIHSDQKVIDVKLSEEQRRLLREIPENIGVDEQKQIEFMTNIMKHDLAATTDWLKIHLSQRGDIGLQEHTENIFDAVHYALTSEDVNSSSFGLMNTRVLKNSILPTILSFQEQLIQYALECDGIVVAGLTHGQPAVYTTLSKRIMNTVDSINTSLEKLIPYKSDGKRHPLLFPGKMGGAIGSLNDHFAAYPDIRWRKHMQEIVESMGLKYKEMTDQCSDFVEYQDFAGILNQITTTIEKCGKDFWSSIQNLWFDKEVQKGHKGSSVMPNKRNPWKIEGGIAIMNKGQAMLNYTTDTIRTYAFEGDMSRSLLTRDIVQDYARIVLGIKRVAAEIGNYVPNTENIERFMDENPGMASAPIMAVLKRAGIGGDAYRLMQSLSYNTETGKNATREQYESGLKALVKEGTIPESVAPEILNLLNPENSLGDAREMTINSIVRSTHTINEIRRAYDIK